MVDSVLVEDEANRDVPKEKLARRLDFFDEDEFDPRMNVDPRTSSVMDSEIKNTLDDIFGLSASDDGDEGGDLSPISAKPVLRQRKKRKAKK